MDNSHLKDSPPPGKKQYLIIFGVLLLLAIPLIFFFRKSSKPVAATVAKVDIAALERAVSDDPSYANLINLSMGYINVGNPGAAIEPLQKALEIKPQSAVAYNNLGVAYTMLKNFPLAIDACNKAVAYDTAFKLAKNNQAWALEEQKKVFTEIIRLEQLPVTDRNSSFYAEMGLNYYYLGNYEKSISIYEEGLAKDINNTVLLNNIGAAMVMTKRYDEAIAQFEKVLKINAADQLAKNNIAWAKSEQAKDSLTAKK